MASGVQISSFVFTGTAVLNEVFGYFKAPSNVLLTNLQISAQQKPVGGDIVVELVDAAEDSLEAEITLGSGSAYQNTILPVPLLLSAGQVVRAKITGVDIGIGGYLTLNLVGATAQTAQAPCGCGPGFAYGW